MGQSMAHEGIYVLMVAPRATLLAPGDAPSRSVAELAMHLGVAEAETVAMVVATELYNFRVHLSRWQLMV